MMRGTVFLRAWLLTIFVMAPCTFLTVMTVIINDINAGGYASSCGSHWVHERDRVEQHGPHQKDVASCLLQLLDGIDESLT